ncbi:MAG TPA: hypothetical protein VI670_14120 [Thermoanaerobaculia bacterium]|jgi:hypothetical protein
MKKALLVVLFAFVLRPVYAQNQPPPPWIVTNSGATVSTDTTNGINSVGIGISVPSYTFHVYSSANTSNYNRLQIDADGTAKVADATGAFQTPQSGDRLNINGTIRGTNVVATYQDVAEWVPATEKMDAGTVVVVNPERNNEVMPSEGAYDTRVAGVVSAQPGVILGVEGPSKAKVATTGRVKVRVDASRHAERVGDLLVTGDRPGVDMVSEPVIVGA